MDDTLRSVSAASGESGVALPLSPAERASGRRLAIASHPAGMTFSMVFSQQLPTLALVSLGASESIVGLQNTLAQAFQALQLPTLRAVGHVSKRTILVLGQVFAVAAAAPLLLFSSLSALEPVVGISMALASFALVSVGLSVSGTVWFPLLRGYVEVEAIGRFFGVLRSGWHLALIVYYLSAQAWIAGHPGGFGPLFLAAWLCGLLRIALIARLPERNERTGEPVRIREAFALVRDQAELRRYLVGVTWAGGVRACTVPFAIVMLRREVGLSDSDVLWTTVAFYAGGLASLYLWGRIVDRVGPAPVFRFTALGMAALIASLVLIREPGLGALVGASVFFFGFSVLSAGFGVADTHVLFGLTPPSAPARTIVVAQVTAHQLSGLAPVIAGFALERLLAASDAAFDAYAGFFLVLAAAQALAFLPLRGFSLPSTRDGREPG